MSKLTSMFLIIIFFICLFIGIFISDIFKDEDDNDTETDTTITITDQTTTPGTPKTISVLFLGINDLENDTLYLESAWSSTIKLSNQNGRDTIEVVLIDIYPPSAEQVTNPIQSQFVKPHDPIIFPKEYLENIEAFDILNTIPIINRSDTYFEDVVIIDEYAMNYIIELTNTNPQLPPPPPTPDTFCKPWKDPEHTHDIQHTILEMMCEPPQNILIYTNLVRIFDLVPDHLVSTMSQNDVMALWQVHVNLETPPSISCEIYP